MSRNISILSRLLAIALTGVLAAGPALAEKPEGAGGGKQAVQGQKDDHGKPDKGGGKKNEKGEGAKGGGVRFDDGSRAAVRDYFAADVKRGNCPPGLAKKNNGCMPPGQVKKWSRGQPLPADVVIYELPVELQVRIGLPPVGHKFVRVASDILMIAVGTNMVVDAIEDLGRL
jgi:Ni/Co efflux regulator RcnB